MRKVLVTTLLVTATVGSQAQVKIKKTTAIITALPKSNVSRFLKSHTFSPICHLTPANNYRLISVCVAGTFIRRMLLINY